MGVEKVENYYTINLIIGKMEFDGNEVANFKLLDYLEIISLDKLEQKLTEFYKKGLEKIKELEKEKQV